MTRQKANLRVLGILMRAASESPDMRFHQLLLLHGILRDKYEQDGTLDGYQDDFYTESEEVLKRIPKGLLK